MQKAATILLGTLAACGGAHVAANDKHVAPIPKATASSASAPANEGDDEEAVVTLYEHGCRDKSGDACNWLGLAYSEGKHGRQRDVPRGIEYFASACDANEPWGCVNAGATMIEQDPTTEPRARVLLDRGCTLGAGRGCSIISTRALDRKDDTTAFEYAKRGCAGHDPFACEILGGLYVTGRGTTKDAIQGAKFYEEACTEERGASCFVLGRLALRGEGVALDEARAISLYTRACDLGHATACNDLGLAFAEGKHGVKTDTKRGRMLLKKACLLKEQVACNNLQTLGDGP